MLATESFFAALTSVRLEMSVMVSPVKRGDRKIVRPQRARRGIIRHGSQESSHQLPGKNGLPIEAGMLALMKLSLREISTSTTIVAR